ncbi:hypothetical protein BH09PAT1_BH09PAT1_3390 [soil metagenome]
MSSVDREGTHMYSVIEMAEIGEEILLEQTKLDTEDEISLEVEIVQDNEGYIYHKYILPNTIILPWRD